MNLHKPLPSREYRIAWHWRFEQDRPLMFDHVKATTAPRAIQKFKNELAREYSFKSTDLVIIGAYPTEGL